MMKRKLFRQISNEWRSNVLIGIELLIVSVVLWYAVDFMTVAVSKRIEPQGFDTTSTLRIDFNSIPSDSPEYVEYEGGMQWWELYYKGINTLLQRVKNHPDVVAAATASGGGQPFDGSWSSTSFVEAFPQQGDTLTVGESRNFDTEGLPDDVSYRLYQVQMTPDNLKVFDIHGIDGETPEELGEILLRGEILLSESAVAQSDRNPRSLRGMQFHMNGDTTRTKRVGAVIPYLNSSSRYTGVSHASKFIELLDSTSAGSYINVRVRPGREEAFIQDLYDNADRLYLAYNTTIDEIKTYSDIAYDYERADRLRLRNWSVCIGFLLLSVFLGVFGTFWSRTQQRVGEIAIRKTFGARRGQISLRLISEGLGILLLATVPAAVIDILIADNELSTHLYGVYLTPARMALEIGVTFLLMAVIIILAIWIPAVRAMRTDPAVSLAAE